MRAKKSMREVIVKIPKRMLNENEHTVVRSECNREEFVYISTKRYESNQEAEIIREDMMKGYIEMSKINLKIATECLHVELEAQHKVERLVSGG